LRDAAGDLIRFPYNIQSFLVPQTHRRPTRSPAVVRGVAPPRSAPLVPPGTLEGLLGHLLRRAQSRLFEAFQVRFARAGFTPGQFGVLLAVAERQAASQSELARALSLERATLGEAVDSLLAAGLVERTRGAADRRTQQVALSRRGAVVVRRVLPAVLAYERALMHGFSATERAAARRVLAHLAGLPAPGAGSRVMRPGRRVR
jgi:DNA-binding MarR family transcriptional regulator